MDSCFALFELVSTVYRTYVMPAKEPTHINWKMTRTLYQVHGLPHHVFQGERRPKSFKTFLAHWIWKNRPYFIVPFPENRRKNCRNSLFSIFWSPSCSPVVVLLTDLQFSFWSTKDKDFGNMSPIIIYRLKLVGLFSLQVFRESRIPTKSVRDDAYNVVCTTAGMLAITSCSETLL